MRATTGRSNTRGGGLSPATAAPCTLLSVGATKGTAAIVEIHSWPVLPIFQHLQAIGNVPDDDMMRTFNMGIGMILVVPSAKFKKAQTILDRCGEKGYTIGRIIKGDRRVTYQ